MIVNSYEVYLAQIVLMRGKEPAERITGKNHQRITQGGNSSCSPSHREKHHNLQGTRNCLEGFNLSSGAKLALVEMVLWSSLRTLNEQ